MMFPCALSAMRRVVCRINESPNIGFRPIAVGNTINHDLQSAGRRKSMSRELKSTIGEPTRIGAKVN